MALIYRVLGNTFADRQDRFVFLDSYRKDGKAQAIGTRYIDIDYESRVREVSAIFKSVEYKNFSAGILISGNIADHICQERTLPLLSARRVLHTMLDRIDDIDCFNRWLEWYKALGFDALSVH